MPYVPCFMHVLVVLKVLSHVGTNDVGVKYNEEDHEAVLALVEYSKEGHEAALALVEYN